MRGDVRVNAAERSVLRELAARVADIAALPVQADRRERWKRHNGLKSREPMILVFPEGSWEELLPDAVLRCRSREARAIEHALRRRIYYHEHFDDDTVIEGDWVVERAIERTGWGLEMRRSAKSHSRGSFAFEPVLKDRRDLARLRHPELVENEAESARRLEIAHDLFDGILEIAPKGWTYVAFHFVQLYTGWRGLAEAMMDMAADPALVHDCMAFIGEGYAGVLDALENRNLLSLNNDATYHSSGGNGYTDDLPAAGFDPARVCLCDMWGSAESQEMAQVGPAMHAEFALAYEKPLLARLGLAGYGCCEDLTRKLPDVLSIPNIRRISIAPWADVVRCAETLGPRAIFSWKPNPSQLVGRFDADAVRDTVRRTVDACRANDCVLEIVLKDTHTCENRQERFDAWTRIARKAVGAAAAASM